MTYLRKLRTGVLVLVGAALVAGCSGAPDVTIGAGEASSAASTALVPATAAPATAAPTTVAPTTTATPTTTTTVAPTTTLALPVSGPEIELVGPPVAPVAANPRGGDAVRAVQQRLLDLGFWVGGVDGSYGLTTRQAVMAFQKHHGLKASGAVDERTAAVLNFSRHRVRGQAWQGTVIEVDKSKQVMYIVRDGRTLWAVNVSTGSERPYVEENKKKPGELATGDSITPVGLWKVDRERSDGWWEGELGKLYRPKYFRGGVAVHGASNIPNYPASHGCVRVSVPAMDFIWAENFMPRGTAVWVHGAIPGKQA